MLNIVECWYRILVHAQCTLVFCFSSDFRFNMLLSTGNEQILNACSFALLSSSLQIFLFLCCFFSLSLPMCSFSPSASQCFPARVPRVFCTSRVLCYEEQKVVLHVIYVFMIQCFLCKLRVITKQAVSHTCPNVAFLWIFTFAYRAICWHSHLDHNFFMISDYTFCEYLIFHISIWLFLSHVFANLCNISLSLSVVVSHIQHTLFFVHRYTKDGLRWSFFVVVLLQTHLVVC